MLVLLFHSCGSGTDANTVAGSLTRAEAPDGTYIWWLEQRIDDEGMASLPVRGAGSLQIADIDKDGFPDIVSAYEKSNHIRAAFGSAEPNAWFRLTLVEGPEVETPKHFSIADLNGDGYQDIVVACGSGQLTYVQNPGGEVRGWPWKRAVLPRTTAGGAYVQVFVDDLNGDGKPKVVAAQVGAGANEGSISWFEVPANPLDGAGWREHEIVKVRGLFTAQTADLDGDHDPDIFVAAESEKRIFWLENTGGNEVRFKEHPIQAGNAVTAGSTVDTADFNGDGRLDAVVGTPPSSVVWLERPKTLEETWKPHSIGSLSPDQIAGIAVADINGDGKPDLMTGSRSRGPESKDSPEVTASDELGRLAWFENPGSEGATWKRHDISRRKRGIFGAFLARDMNGDGYMDFVGTRAGSDEYDGVFWLQQMRSKKPVRVFQPARKQESEEMPLPDR